MPFVLQVDLTNPAGSWIADPEESRPVAEAAVGSLLAGFAVGDLTASESDVAIGPCHGGAVGWKEAHGDGDEEPAILEYRVRSGSRDARITAVVDVSDWQVATAVAVGLGRRVCTWSPQMKDWRPAGFGVTALAGRFDDQRWLPDDHVLYGIRHDVADWLPQPVIELGCHYLLAGAVRDLWEGAENDNDTVPVDGLLAGAGDLPWVRDLTAELAELLLAARLVEEGAGARASLVAGPGDDDVAEDLLAWVRALPSDALHEELIMWRLLDVWISQRGLEHSRIDPDLDATMQCFRDETNRRAMLAAGVRALATLAASLAGRVDSTLELVEELDPTPLVVAAACLDREARITATAWTGSPPGAGWRRRWLSRWDWLARWGRSASRTAVLRPPHSLTHRTR